MVQEIHGWSYDQRLNFLRWSTSEDRRLRGDVIQVFKLIKGFDIAAPNTVFDLSTTDLRGHTFKLYKSTSSTNIGNFSFSQLLKIKIAHNCTLFQLTSLTLLNPFGLSLFALSGF